MYILIFLKINIKLINKDKIYLKDCKTFKESKLSEFHIEFSKLGLCTKTHRTFKVEAIWCLLKSYGPSQQSQLHGDFLKSYGLSQQRQLHGDFSKVSNPFNQYYL